MISKPEIHEKVWGKELWIVNNGLYCGKILELRGGYRCSMHHHRKKDETFYIISGVVFMEAGGREFLMQTGDALRLEPKTDHRFTGIKDSQILEISTHHEEEDNYRTTSSEKVPDAEFVGLERRHIVE